MTKEKLIETMTTTVDAMYTQGAVDNATAEKIADGVCTLVTEAVGKATAENPLFQELLLALKNAVLDYQLEKM